MKTQATRLNQAQLQQEIQRQRHGLPCRFAHRHPIADAVIGSLVLAVGIGSMIALWIAVGAAQ